MFSSIRDFHHTPNRGKFVYLADESGQIQFDHIFDQIGVARKSSTNENLNAELSKLPGTILRIEGALHVLENVI